MSTDHPIERLLPAVEQTFGAEKSPATLLKTTVGIINVPDASSCLTAPRKGSFGVLKRIAVHDPASQDTLLVFCAGPGNSAPNTLAHVTVLSMLLLRWLNSIGKSGAVQITPYFISEVLHQAVRRLRLMPIFALAGTVLKLLFGMYRKQAYRTSPSAGLACVCRRT